MIGKLTGRLDTIAEDSLIVDVGGVGYLVFCSMRTRDALPAPGEPLSLHIETRVREDRISLYGFHTLADRDWFRALTTVQGVGTRLALAILSALGPERLADALLAEDKRMLTQAPGVGAKLAGRILSELNDRAATLAGPMSTCPAVSSDGVPVESAVSALVNLGYRRGEALGAVSSAARDLGSEASVEALIQAGLKGLAR